MRRCGRVVDCTGLENQQRATFREFESHRLRQNASKKAPFRALFFTPSAPTCQPPPQDFWLSGRLSRLSHFARSGRPHRRVQSFFLAPAIGSHRSSGHQAANFVSHQSNRHRFTLLDFFTQRRGQQGSNKAIDLFLQCWQLRQGRRPGFRQDSR